MSKTDELLEKIYNKLNYLTLLQEFVVIANMSAAHDSTAKGLQAEARMMLEDLQKQKKAGVEIDEEVEERVRNEIGQRLGDSQMFAFVFDNDAKALDILIKKLMPVLHKKYPILARTPKDVVKTRPDDGKCSHPGCNRPGSMPYNNQLLCREHFKRALKAERIRKEEEDDAKIQAEAKSGNSPNK